MKRGRGEASFSPQVLLKTSRIDFLLVRSDFWRAYRYESARRRIRHPVRVQRGLVTRLGTTVVVSRVSGGEYQFSELVRIASSRDLECRIQGGFRQECSVTASESVRWLSCIECLSFETFPGLLLDSSSYPWRFPSETFRVVHEYQDVLSPQVSCLCLSWSCRCGSIDLLSNWRNRFAHWSTNSSRNLDVSSRAY